MIKLLTHNDNDLQSPVAKSRKKYGRLLCEGVAVRQTRRRIGAPRMGSVHTQGFNQVFNLNNINRLVISISCADPVYGHLYGLASKAKHDRGFVAGTAHAAVN